MGRVGGGIDWSQAVLPSGCAVDAYGVVDLTPRLSAGCGCGGAEPSPDSSSRGSPRRTPGRGGLQAPEGRVGLPASRSRSDVDNCIELCSELVPPPFNLLCPVVCEAILGAESTDDCLATCEVLVPYPASLNCERMCGEGVTAPAGSDYWDAPRDAGADGYSSPCMDGLQVSVPPSATTAGQYAGYTFDDMCSGLLRSYDFVIDGEVGSTTSARHPVNSMQEYTWFKAPDDLLTMWPSFAASFDDPEFEWIYLSVGMTVPQIQVCGPVIAPATRIPNQTYVVTALRPYVVYSFTNVGAEGRDSADTKGLRIRYWVGVVNNFSIFVPGSTSEVATFGPADIAAAFPSFNATTGAITSRGQLVSFWASYVPQTSAGVAWEDPVTGASTTGTFFACNAGLNPASVQYNYSYVQNDGTTPTGLCFSDRQAWDLAPTDASGDMTALLGAALSGEVCVVGDRAGFNLTAALQEGFEALFGKSVTVSVEVQYNDYVGRGFGDDADPNSPPHSLTRQFCLTSGDLEEATSFAARLLAKRTTPETMWLYRDFDPTRLTAAVAGFKAQAQPCGCTWSVGG